MARGKYIDNVVEGKRYFDKSLVDGYPPIILVYRDGDTKKLKVVNYKRDLNYFKLLSSRVNAIDNYFEVHNLGGDFDIKGNRLSNYTICPLVNKICNTSIPVSVFDEDLVNNNYIYIDNFELHLSKELKSGGKHYEEYLQEKEFSNQVKLKRIKLIYNSEGDVIGQIPINPFKKIYKPLPLSRTISAAPNMEYLGMEVPFYSRVIKFEEDSNYLTLSLFCLSGKLEVNDSFYYINSGGSYYFNPVEVGVYNPVEVGEDDFNLEKINSGYISDGQIGYIKIENTLDNYLNAFVGQYIKKK